MTRPAMSTRQSSRRTADAADQLLGWLRQQNGLPDRSGDGQADPGPLAGGGAEAPSPDPPTPLVPAKCEASAREDASRGLDEGLEQEREVGRSLARRVEHSDEAARTAPPLRPAHTDWLHHRFLVAGPAGTLADFQAAACGAGTVPWRLDLDRVGEDLFLLLAAPPPSQRRRLSLAGAHAGRPAPRRGGAAARRGDGPCGTEPRRNAGQPQTAVRFRRVCGWACAFDLHALVPVPDGLLGLGPDHPEALAWLWTHWGTTAALRHAAAGPVLPRRASPSDPATLRLAFWSVDWTPWLALLLNFGFCGTFRAVGWPHAGPRCASTSAPPTACCDRGRVRCRDRGCAAEGAARPAGARVGRAAAAPIGRDVAHPGLGRVRGAARLAARPGAPARST